MATLRLRYEPENAHHGELFATVEVPGFSASGSAWFSLQQLLEFRDSLATYPITRDAPLDLSGGIWEGNVLTSRWLGLTISPWNTSGRLLVSVELSSQPPVEATQRSTLQLMTEYAALGEFRAGFRKMLDGDGEAELTGN